VTENVTPEICLCVYNNYLVIRMIGTSIFKIIDSSTPLTAYPTHNTCRLDIGPEEKSVICDLLPFLQFKIVGAFRKLEQDPAFSNTIEMFLNFHMHICTEGLYLPPPSAIIKPRCVKSKGRYENEKKLYRYILRVCLCCGIGL
jgi:hypothetical protein